MSQPLALFLGPGTYGKSHEARSCLASYRLRVLPFVQALTSLGWPDSTARCRGVLPCAAVTKGAFVVFFLSLRCECRLAQCVAEIVILVKRLLAKYFSPRGKNPRYNELAEPRGELVISRLFSRAFSR